MATLPILNTNKMWQLINIGKHIGAHSFGDFK